MAIERFSDYTEEVYKNEADAVLNKAIDNLVNYKAHHNRKYVYEPSEEGFKKFQEATEAYFNWVKNANMNLEDGKKPVVPDIEGWATALSLTRVSIFRYHKERGEPWTGYIDYVRELIVSLKKQAGMSGRIPPVSLIFDMCNNGGYYNTSTFTRPLPSGRETMKQGLTLEDLQTLTLEDFKRTE